MDTSGPDTPGAEEEVPVEPPPETAPPEEAEPSLDTTGAEDVILQGIADCFFYTDDGIVLIDYKTDRVSKSGAALRSEAYRVQMEYYARGLSAIFNLPVKERYLYFLSCGEVVKV